MKIVFIFDTSKSFKNIFFSEIAFEWIDRKKNLICNVPLFIDSTLYISAFIYSLIIYASSIIGLFSIYCNDDTWKVVFSFASNSHFIDLWRMHKFLSIKFNNSFNSINICCLCNYFQLSSRGPLIRSQGEKKLIFSLNLLLIYQCELWTSISLGKN